MKIKQAAKATGLSEKAIRYYEGQGLLSPAKSFINGRYFRSYCADDVARLNTIATLRRCRMPIESIKHIIEHPGDIPQVLARHREAVQEEYTRLSDLLKVLSRVDGAENADKLAETLTREYELSGAQMAIARETDALCGRALQKIKEAKRYYYLAYFFGMTIILSVLSTVFVNIGGNRVGELRGIAARLAELASRLDINVAVESEMTLSRQYAGLFRDYATPSISMLGYNADVFEYIDAVQDGARTIKHQLEKVL